MRLYLVQHGDALAKEIAPARPLSAEGQKDAVRLASFLGGRVEVARIVHSGKLRAEQTADLLAVSVAPGKPVEAISGISPHDEVEPFVEQALGWGGDTLVVGHLPFMAKLVAQLVTGSEEMTITAYQPGSIVCLESGEGDGWQIQWMIRPELLRE